MSAYHFESQVTNNGDAQTLHEKLVQSGVKENFKMAVPLYLELTDGKTIRAGSITIVGASTAETTKQLRKMTSPVKRAMIDYYYDVLCTEN